MPRPLPLLADAAGDVYGLVAHLSPAEITALRKSWNTGQRKQPLHLRLFDAIADDKVRDDAAAQSVIGVGSGAQFSNLKQYLLSEILDGLIWIQRDSIPSTRLHLGIIQLQILIDRSQIAVARRLCKKLLALAVRAGHFSFTIQLLHYRTRLLEQKSYKQYRAEVDAISHEIDQYCLYQQTSQAIQRFTNQLAVLRTADQLRVTDDQNESLQALVGRLTGLSEASTATPHLRLQYLATYAIAQYSARSFHLCTTACEEALDLLESTPELAVAAPESFLSIANIAFYNEFALGSISQVSSWLSRFDSLAIVADNNDYFHKRWAIILFHTTLKIAHKTADFEGVAQLIASRSKIIMGYTAEVLPPADAMSIQASVLISYFVLEQYDRAEELMLDIKERNRLFERQDLFYFTLVFHLVILFERRNWYRLDAATEAAYHVLYNKKKLRPFEQELMRFLKALPGKRGKGETGDFIKAFLVKLEVYRADPVQRLYFLYFDYYDWLQSKLAGVSYMEYKRRLRTSGDTGGV